MKEDTCQSTNGNAESADTSSSNSKTTSPSETTRSSAPSAEPSQPEPSTREPASDLWVGDGPVLTSGKLRADPTDNKQTRWEKFKDFMLLNRAKPNPLLLNPKAKVIGTFTVHQNGYIEDGVAVTDNPSARAFQALAIQLSRQTFRVSAQPVDKRKPRWWGPRYGTLILEFLESKRRAMMELNERKFKAAGSNIMLDSQTPQIGKKK